MKLSSVYPVIMTDKVKEVAEFYTSIFKFKTTFESDWYISLVLKQDEKQFELAVLDHQHETIPEVYRKMAGGFLINIEVDDATVLYEKLTNSNGVEVVKGIKDEDFGQRHFIIKDPADILIDVIENIPPSEEFMKMYQMEA
ncbi:VOC family protein [Anoxynatronum buryatiense]|uniref:Glyoxalase/Bleomycin resistance protein/Dioxygenase superfamily protein n=1 Tax=Anoxynatronum buryatiense TaxID=489973 RepID=A0AA45WXT7_9CLOT|nr:VOC family protein [Anoxynatronum buryatiense]SMP65975.1 Glyoxalase/Bleomycin resistance protein/Dioxygenase superfamily protein [Anoxynatronum buryatiense]